MTTYLTRMHVSPHAFIITSAHFAERRSEAVRRVNATSDWCRGSFVLATCNTGSLTSEKDIRLRTSTTSCCCCGLRGRSRYRRYPAQYGSPQLIWRGVHSTWHHPPSCNGSWLVGSIPRSLTMGSPRDIDDPHLWHLCSSLALMTLCSRLTHSRSSSHRCEWPPQIVQVQHSKSSKASSV